MKLWSLVLVAVLALASFESEAARRMGGGGSLGRQSSNVTQREAAKPARRADQNQAAPATQPGANPAAAAPKRPWGAMLGGLAAGLGLAWLAHSLGLGAAFGQFLMIALLVMVAMVVIGAIMRSRRQGQASRGYAFQGAGARRRCGRAAAAIQPRQGRQRRVGPAVGAQQHGFRGRQAGQRRADRLRPGGLADLGRSGRLRRGRLRDGGQAQLRDPAGCLGPRRHRNPALHDDRRHAGGDQVPAGRARAAHRRRSPTRPRW